MFGSVDSFIADNVAFIKFYNQLMTDKILKKMQVENGVVTRVNGDSRYAVRITGKDTSIPNVKNSDGNNAIYKIGDNVLVQFPFGSRELARIIGYSDLSVGVELIHNFTEGGSSPPPCCCFLAGTKILTSRGKINIEDIKSGDYVWGYNEKLRIIHINKVVKLLIHNKSYELFNEYYNIKSEKYGGYECEVNVTHNHPFFVGKNKYDNIENINVHQGLYCYNYRNYGGNIKKVKLERKKLIKVDVPVVTYNLELNSEGTHNYFANNFLVHNSGGK